MGEIFLDLIRLQKIIGKTVFFLMWRQLLAAPVLRSANEEFEGSAVLKSHFTRRNSPLNEKAKTNRRFFCIIYLQKRKGKR